MNIKYHTGRVNESREKLFGFYDRWNLTELIKIPDLDPTIVYRCRFLYSREVEKIEFIPYVKREIKKLYSIDCNNLDYSFKYADRRLFDQLRSHIPDPANADLIFIRNGLITDASFANIVFKDDTGWYTPASPLLKGTKRQFYIENGTIVEKEIRWSDLHEYKTARLINAMIDLDESDDIPVTQIIRL